MMKLGSLKLVSRGLYTDEPKGVLVDTRKCVACKACTISCKFWNDNPRDTETHKTKPSASTYTVISETETEKNGKPVYALVKQQCMHCLEPWCVNVCPTGALYKTGDGPVLYDSTLCIGCKYCVQACPYNIPHFDEEAHLIKKCTMCKDRIELGLEPACVNTCITGALQFGSRDKIVEQAQMAENEGFKVFGIDDGGGTSWIYIFQKNIEPKEVGFPELGSNPPSKFNLNMIRSVTGMGGVTVALTLAGIAASKYAERRNSVSESKKSKKKEE